MRSLNAPSSHVGQCTESSDSDVRSLQRCSRRAPSRVVMCLGVLAGVVFLVDPVPASTLYGALYFGGSRVELARIDTNTGRATLIGPTDVVELSAHDGRLYGFDARHQSQGPLDGAIVRLDPATGATLENMSNAEISHTPLPPNGMAIRSDGTVFVSLGGNPLADGAEFYNCGVFDTCASIDIGPARGTGMDGLAFDASDVLYGLSRHRTFGQGEMDISLYTLDPSGPIKPTGLFGDFSEGLSFDPETGTLYAGVADRLYTIDVATGAATFIGTTGSGEILGLAFLSSVPEPSAGVVLAGTVVVLAWRSPFRQGRRSGSGQPRRGRESARCR
jgi:hypothetical protein